MGNNYTSSLGISGGGVQPTGDAQVGDVLAGKTFSNADGIGKTGTMVNNGAVSGTATPSQPYTIPQGYHNGSGTVTAPKDLSVGSTHYEVGTNDVTITCAIGDLIVLAGLLSSSDNVVVSGGTQIDRFQASANPSYAAVTIKATSTSLTVRATGGAGSAYLIGTVVTA